WIGLGCSAVFLLFLAQSGGRRLLVVVVGAAMLTWLCANRRTLRLRHILGTSVLIAANIVLLDFILTNRTVGFGGAAYNVSSFEEVRVDDNFWSLTETLRIIPERHPFVGFQHLLFISVRPVPRVLWPGKPL